MVLSSLNSNKIGLSKTERLLSFNENGKAQDKVFVPFLPSFLGELNLALKRTRMSPKHTLLCQD